MARNYIGFGKIAPGPDQAHCLAIGADRIGSYALGRNEKPRRSGVFAVSLDPVTPGESINTICDKHGEPCGTRQRPWGSVNASRLPIVWQSTLKNASRKAAMIVDIPGRTGGN
jgi:hypothetical protein